MTVKERRIKTMKEENKVGMLHNVSGKKPPKLGKVELISFHWFKKKVGSLEFKGEKLHFKGDVNKSAKALFDKLKQFVEQYIQERLLLQYQGAVIDELNHISACSVTRYEIIKDIVKSLDKLTDKDHNLILQITQLTEKLSMDLLMQKREFKDAKHS